MILDISNREFKNIFDNQQLFLPIRWDGSDFETTLRNLFNCYIKQIEKAIDSNRINDDHFKEHFQKIKQVCGLITTTVNQYFNGFPSEAYISFEKIMRILVSLPLEIFRQHLEVQFNTHSTLYGGDDLILYRAVGVEDNKPYERKRVFHTPYNLRSKVSTCRYSIAGYPSLYLGTSLQLCCEEMQVSSHQNYTLASVFRLENTPEYSNTNIRVIELGIKPQDFLTMERESNHIHRSFPKDLLFDKKTKASYLLWYPLIASCSYIRVNKKDPFAAEYIIPQLLMQWSRSRICLNKINNYDQLFGIRYFSCASEKASDMGFNYVFPTSGNQISCELPYCSVLAKAFRLTEPRYIHEYNDINTCEYIIQNAGDFDYIFNT